MELFNKRYLCFFAFLFIFSSVVVYKLPLDTKLVAVIAVAILCAVAIVLAVAFRKNRFPFIVAAVSVLSVFAATANSLLFVSLPKERAGELLGSQVMQMDIITCEYGNGTEDSSEYLVRITSANGEKQNVKAYLICDFPSDYSYGDRLIGKVSASELNKSGVDTDNDALLLLEPDVEKPLYYKRAEKINPFSYDGIRAISSKARNTFADYIDEVFGEQSRLVKGMLINDKSGLTTYNKAQFSRAGVSHLLAVSGLHISLLLGAFELLLKKLLVPKTIRMAAVSLGSIGLLVLTGFSPSAVRSVLMLLAVYFSFMLSEENDSVTSLFCAVGFMVLITPFSIEDLGMWMSFAATLGLVSVYPIIENYKPQAEKSGRLTGLIVKAGFGILRLVILTLVANIFTLPIVWYYFGRISLASVPCNLILSPLVTLFLPLCVMGLAFAGIPFIGNAVVFSAKTIASAMYGVIGCFADLRGAVLSLRYPFVPILVGLMTLSMAVLMVVKLRRKIFICLPAASFAVLFAVCLGIFSLTVKPSVRYVGNGNNEVIFAEKGSTSTVFDVSEGSVWSYKLISEELCPYSVEIENYVITHPHKGHVTMLERLYESSVIRKLYIPVIPENEELGLSKEIYDIARRYNTSVIFYDSGKSVELWDGLAAYPCFEMTDEGISVFIRFGGEEENPLTYTDGSENAKAFAIGCESRYFLVGEHGRSKGNAQSELPRLSDNTTVIFATEEVMENSVLKGSNRRARVIGGKRREFFVIP